MSSTHIPGEFDDRISEEEHYVEADVFYHPDATTTSTTDAAHMNESSYDEPSSYVPMESFSRGQQPKSKLDQLYDGVVAGQYNSSNGHLSMKSAGHAVKTSLSLLKNRIAIGSARGVAAPSPKAVIASETKTSSIDDDQRASSDSMDSVDSGGDDDFDIESAQSPIAAFLKKQRRPKKTSLNQKKKKSNVGFNLKRVGTVHELTADGTELLFAKEYRFFYYLGSMDWLTTFIEEEVDQRALRFLLWVVTLTLRGLGQVMFMNSPLSGALITIAAFIQDPYVALFMLTGCGGSTLFAYAVGAGWKAISAGLFGYNGALVGLALGTFGLNLDGFWVGVVLFLSFVSTVWLLGLANVLSSHFHVPVLTLPFNLACFLFFFASSTLPTFNLAFTPNATVAVQVARDDDSLEAYFSTVFGDEIVDVLEAVLRGFGQIFFFDDVVSGLLVFVAGLVCSPLGALLGLMGVIVGMATGFACGANTAGIYAGLWGYNACLASIAVGGMFFVFSRKSVLFAAFCGCCSALCAPSLQVFWLGTGVPVLTMPFCVMTLPFLLIGKSLDGLVPVPLTRCTYAEDNFLHFKHTSQVHVRRSIFH